jgi:hypothetical protein
VRVANEAADLPMQSGLFGAAIELRRFSAWDRKQVAREFRRYGAQPDPVTQSVNHLPVGSGNRCALGRFSNTVAHLHPYAV